MNRFLNDHRETERAHTERAGKVTRLHSESDTDDRQAFAGEMKEQQAARD